MTNYINPHQSDEQTLREHALLSKRQAQQDHAEIKAKGGFDADFFFGNAHNPGRLPAWAKHPARCRCWDCCQCPDCRERRESEEER